MGFRVGVRLQGYRNSARYADGVDVLEWFSDTDGFLIEYGLIVGVRRGLFVRGWDV